MVQITPLLQALAVVAQASPAAHDVSPNALAVRQISTSGLPSQCQSSCQVVNTITNCGTSVSCVCASSVGPDLQSCMNCLVAADPAVQTDAQSVIDSWNEGCGGSLSLNGGSSTTTASSSASAETTSSGVVGMKAATGAIGLAVIIACSILIL
ncbi:hypothetical protein DFH29DRAFT_959312 [Suillus ampliporus]|nr:hypothetical protein DFH29DRAFT_959312 [Suillus ampliporus]